MLYSYANCGNIYEESGAGAGAEAEAGSGASEGDDGCGNDVSINILFHLNVGPEEADVEADTSSDGAADDVTDTTAEDDAAAVDDSA